MAANDSVEWQCRPRLTSNEESRDQGGHVVLEAGGDVQRATARGGQSADGDTRWNRPLCLLRQTTGAFGDSGNMCRTLVPNAYPKIQTHSMFAFCAFHIRTIAYGAKFQTVEGDGRVAHQQEAADEQEADRGRHDDGDDLATRGQVILCAPVYFIRGLSIQHKKGEARDGSMRS